MKKEKRTLVPWPVACGCRQLLTVAVKLIAKTLVTQARDNSVIPSSHQYIGLHFILGPNFQGPNFEGPWKLLGEFGIQYCIKTSLWFLLFGSRPMQLPSVYTEDADLSVNIHQLPTKWQWNSKMKKKPQKHRVITFKGKAVTFDTCMFQQQGTTFTLKVNPVHFLFASHFFSCYFYSSSSLTVKCAI